MEGGLYMSLSILMIPMLVVIFATEALPQGHQCKDPPDVVIFSSKAPDVAEICASAAKAIAFLEHLELTPRRDIRINIVDEPIIRAGIKLHGGYRPGSDEILLMSYAAILKQPQQVQIYGEALDKSYYSGLVAHEIAHAVVQHNIPGGGPTIAHEYLAYATQLAVIPKERLRSIITAAGTSPWKPGSIISAGYMALDPRKFAVKSYLHLISVQDSPAFIAMLLKTKGSSILLP